MAQLDQPDSTLAAAIQLIGGPACGTLIERPEGWPNIPHAKVPWRGAVLYYAPEPGAQGTAIFDRQDGEIDPPTQELAV